VGGLTSMLVLLKGLPRAYNKDLQEDKEAVFDTCRTMRGAIPIMAGVLATLKLNEYVPSLNTHISTHTPCNHFCPS
jgi:argininosuccinate lyase